MSAGSRFVARLEEIRLSYRQGESWLPVLQGVSLDIERGEVLGLVGESGCGKSTLALLLLGFRHPNARVDGGRARFEDIDVLGLRREALDRIRGRRVALVPQDPTTALNPSMRVGAQVAEVLRVHEGPNADADAFARAVEVFGSVGLPDPPAIARRYPHQLSGGQQQRVTIAMALACRPSLVVLDEPTTGLDVTTQDQILRLLADLRSRFGMAMLYVTHDLGVVAQIADRVSVMYAGHVVETAPTERLFHQPHHPYTRGLIASVPRIAQDAKPARQPLRGLLRRSELPPGCPFEPRCDFAEPSCAEAAQRLEAVAPTHFVACQRWKSVARTSDDSGSPGLSITASGSAPGPATPLVSFEEISLRYGSHAWLERLTGRSPPAVVHDVSFAIARGEVFGLVGESGSGKSTIAKALSGLLAPSTGRIVFDGEPLPEHIAERSRDQKRRIQYVFQNPDASLNPRARVRTALGRPIVEFLAAKRSELAARVGAALDAVRLPEAYAERFPDQLSGGERQRVAIARALVAQPDLLLCDEVLSALDVSVQASILGLLEALKRDTEVAMLFISHDLAVVRSLADRVAVLFQGRLLEVGDQEEVFAPPFHPYTFGLLQAVPDIDRRGEPWRRKAHPEPPAAAGACVFAGRCPWQLGERCETVPPPWREAGPTHRIRCHHELDELKRLATHDSTEGLSHNQREERVTMADID